MTVEAGAEVRIGLSRPYLFLRRKFVDKNIENGSLRMRFEVFSDELLPDFNFDELL